MGLLTSVGVNEDEVVVVVVVDEDERVVLEINGYG